jgi:hypothetical protein
VRFGCEGLVVFWGSCVVFWCSFWVGFWLSESLRGVFTPARNGRLQTSPVHGGGTPSPRAGRAGVGAFKAQGVTIPEKCVIIGIAVRWRGRVAETLLKEDER